MKYEAQAQMVLDSLDDANVAAIAMHTVPFSLEEALVGALRMVGVPSYDVQAGYHALSVLAERRKAASVGETTDG